MYRRSQPRHRGAQRVARGLIVAGAAALSIVGVTAASAATGPAPSTLAAGYIQADPGNSPPVDQPTTPAQTTAAETPADTHGPIDEKTTTPPADHGGGQGGGSQAASETTQSTRRPAAKATGRPARRSTAGGTSSGGLANTGTDLVPIAGLGLVMTIGGVLLLIHSRRRPKASA